MKPNLRDLFFYSTAVILFVMAASELLISKGIPALLNYPDPIFGLPNQVMLCLLAGLNLVVSAFLLFRSKRRFKAELVAWLANVLLVYRVGETSLGVPFLPSCLGNLSDWLPLSPHLLDRINLVLLGYFLSGSIIVMVLEWREWRQAAENTAIQTQNQKKPAEAT